MSLRSIILEKGISLSPVNMNFEMLCYVAASLIVLYLAYEIFGQLFDPLRSLPGPLITRFTRLWFFRCIIKGQFHYENIDLHDKYGPIVRIAPNMYSIKVADPVAYGIATKFTKSNFYRGLGHPDPERTTIIAEQDKKRHAHARKSSQHLYSMTSLLSYEKYADECNDILSERLQNFAGTGETVNLGHWLQCYAFDVIGNITFSKRFGFLDEGIDIEKSMESLDNTILFSSLTGTYWEFHPLAYYIAERIPGSGAAGRNYFIKTVQDKIKSRREERIKTLKKNETKGMLKDFLDKLLDAHEANPDKVPIKHVFMTPASNIFAGSDTTSISLSSILFNLWKHPQTLKKLREEIWSFEEQGKISKTRITFKEAQEMPYLQAVLKEAMRLHPATGFPLFRTVPEGGAIVAGQYFPAGSSVGVNTWVVHYDKSIFGNDARQFRPERWLNADADTLKKMEANWIPFGMGSRTCIGRHIAHLETCKLVPRIVRDFDFDLEVPGERLSSLNYSFVKQRDFFVRVNKNAHRISKEN